MQQSIPDPSPSDLSDRIRFSGSTVRLPFIPSQVVENLRRERYMAERFAQGHGILAGMVIREIDYRLRPLLGIPVRKHLQKFALRDWKKLPFPAWPVDTTVERIDEQLLILCMKAGGLDECPSFGSGLRVRRAVQ